MGICLVFTPYRFKESKKIKTGIIGFIFTILTTTVAKIGGKASGPVFQDSVNLEGESSLPFHEFVSRMYAFHYNPFEQGDTYMVEDSLVEKVEALAKDSWGKNYVWA